MPRANYDAHDDVQGAERLAEAVAVANIPTLLLVLVQLTGDLSWLEEPITGGKGMEDNDTGGLPEERQTEIRAAALDAIHEWKAGKPMAIPRPSSELMVRMLGVSMGGDDVPVEYAPMLADSLGAEPHDRVVDLAVEPPDGFGVLIIGAGVSGIAAGVMLRKLGVNFTIVERNADLGGTWLENRYPGAGVDTPSHLYQYSFLNHDWSMYFAQRDEIMVYLTDVATAFGVMARIRFSTSVVEARYDEDGRGWRVVVRDDRGTETLWADAVISAVGTFSAPKLPALPGLDSFEGPCFHTARWPEGLHLSGKRVGVLGTGASAMQVVPAIADEVSSLVVFQRSPQWVQPFPKHLKPVPEAIRFLAREVPLYYGWQRVRLNWIFHDKLHDSLQKDPDWPHPERSLNATNDRHREYFTRYIERELEGHADLVDKCVPTYPPFGKRMLLDNGGWFRTLKRDHVELVTESLAEVKRDRVVTASGEQYELDVLVLATGFDCVRYLSSFEVTGRDARTLRDEWADDDGRAYLGLVVPGFPNFFMLYGPNTQPGHGGSLIHTIERQLRYLTSLLGQMFGERIAAVECRREVYEDYNRRVDDAHSKMVWTHPGMETYYRNARGRVVVNMPFRNLDFWRMTEHADLAEFNTESRPEGAAVTAGAVRD